jgi:hypothetical protein
MLWMILARTVKIGALNSQRDSGNTHLVCNIASARNWLLPSLVLVGCALLTSLPNPKPDWVLENVVQGNIIE